METIKVKAKQDPTVEFVVKVEFLKTCPDPDNVMEYDLMDKHQIYNYLHNTEGPAFTHLVENLEGYFIDGEFIGLLNKNDNNWVYVGNNEEERNKSKEKIDAIIYGKNFKEGFDKAIHE